MLTRATVLIVGLVASPSGAVMWGRAQPAVVIVTAGLGWVEIRRRHEPLLLANLGFSAAQIGAAVVLPPLLLEMAIGSFGGR